ncbi:MAG: hypothetical protein HRU71_05000 [Planctomycetia bacterium]|nr:MAG: hypothetical protein HRU71_05000 [Planctomycetia bacterium]
MAATNGVFFTVAATGFTVAFFHAAIPTHWLPFVLASRAQRWSRAKTLAITAIAGGGHVLFTTLLGVFIAWLGIAINERIGDLFPWIAGGALIVFGLYYVFGQLSGKGHGHSHASGGHSHAARKHSHHDHGHEHSDHGHDHSHPHPHERPDHAHDGETTVADEMKDFRALEQPKPTSDWVAIGSLFALLTFSPCEGFLPVYLSGIRYGWMGFALLSAILAGATLSGMVIFTWLTLIGLEKLKLQLLEKYESGILGGALCLLGVLVILFEHQ